MAELVAQSVGDQLLPCEIDESARDDLDLERYALIPELVGKFQ